jgi:hypothetical protein
VRIPAVVCHRTSISLRERHVPSGQI